MTDYEQKSIKVLERIIIKNDPQDPNMDYENKSEDPENNLVISVFVSSFDYYRASIPYTALGEAGASVMISKPHTAGEVKYWDNSKFLVLNKIISLDYFNTVKKSAEDIGAMLVYDLDDNIHEVEPWNYAYEIYNPESEQGLRNLSLLEYIISNCDHVIYSTRELKKYYDTLNPNSSVMPNFLDIDKRYRNVEPIDWKKMAISQNVLFDEDSILIGFFGSDSHIEDLCILQESVMKILADNKKVIFAILTGQDLISSVLIKKWGISSNRFLFMPFQNIHEYLKYVACFDIGLAPLHTSIFNVCKSNLKLLEYGALGIPYVASKVANFQRFHVESDKVGGFICDTNQEWIDKINFLIDNPEIRKEMGNKLKEYVYNQYDVKNAIVLIANIFRTLYMNHNKLRKRPNIIELADSYDSIPHVKLVYFEDDVCPCGSGEKYINCNNNCYPAWGEIVKEDICQ
jgi:glycosyltransferase involved in cell wall biosynthesis